jgi:hypothetical protein
MRAYINKLKSIKELKKSNIVAMIFIDFIPLVLSFIHSTFITTESKLFEVIE